jgi:hypothetical protein
MSDNKKIITPQIKAEQIFGEIIALSNECATTEEKLAKLESGKKAAIRVLDAHVDYWLQTRAEFENLIKLTEK